MRSFRRVALVAAVVTALGLVRAPAAYAEPMTLVLDGEVDMTPGIPLDGSFEGQTYTGAFTGVVASTSYSGPVQCWLYGYGYDSLHQGTMSGSLDCYPYGLVETASALGWLSFAIHFARIGVTIAVTTTGGPALLIGAGVAVALVVAANNITKSRVTAKAVGS